ncbi:hypothetical protein GCM10025865_21070 [Paraoerskovia sediminicola]|uniref:Uncharacterized protein n=1 Tax=Paraoerskovia sediminicola TaxID=1138587 RepID=A0ABN6XCY5_9CELL|nr:hypothetical protein GCM10025865_21070 [Paraoerskovia sediminicola]
MTVESPEPVVTVSIEMLVPPSVYIESVSSAAPVSDDVPPVVAVASPPASPAPASPPASLPLPPSLAFAASYADTSSISTCSITKRSSAHAVVEPSVRVSASPPATRMRRLFRRGCGGRAVLFGSMPAVLRTLLARRAGAG